MNSECDRATLMKEEEEEEVEEERRRKRGGRGFTGKFRPWFTDHNDCS